MNFFSGLKPDINTWSMIRRFSGWIYLCATATTRQVLVRRRLVYVQMPRVRALESPKDDICKHKISCSLPAPWFRQLLLLCCCSVELASAAACHRSVNTIEGLYQTHITTHEPSCILRKTIWPVSFPAGGVATLTRVRIKLKWHSPSLLARSKMSCGGQQENFPNQGHADFPAGLQLVCVVRVTSA